MYIYIYICLTSIVWVWVSRWGPEFYNILFIPSWWSTKTQSGAATGFQRVAVPGWVAVEKAIGTSTRIESDRNEPKAKSHQNSNNLDEVAFYVFWWLLYDHLTLISKRWRIVNAQRCMLWIWMIWVSKHAMLTWKHSSPYGSTTSMPMHGIL